MESSYNRIKTNEQPDRRHLKSLQALSVNLSNFIYIYSFISVVLSSRPRLPFGLHPLICVFPMFLISSSSSVFLPLGGVKVDLFLASLFSGAESRKYSFSSNFLL